MQDSEQPPKRSILLLCNDWSNVRDGITSVNRSLALNLAKYTSVKVYSTLFKWRTELSSAELKDAEDNGIILIEPSTQASGRSLDIKSSYTFVSENPISVWGNLADHAPNITHIIGHAPITAEAALKLRENVYPKAHVTLFYHVTPADVSWLHEALPYMAPTDTELVRLAEMADVVFSVTEKLHWYFTAKFRNRAQRPVDHRLYLPQASHELFDLKRNTEVNPTILCLAAGEGIDPWLGVDIGACAAQKVNALQPKVKLVVGNVALEKQVPAQTSLLDVTGDCDVTFHAYNSAGDLAQDLQNCALCVVPSRAEPFGHVGLRCMSAGVPTLIAENSSLAPLIRRLTSDADYFLVPVTQSKAAVRQDGSTWRDKIQDVLQDPKRAKAYARQLQLALRRDERSKHTHDDFVALCLGGIHVAHETVSVQLQHKTDQDKELQITKNVNVFLQDILRQAWRLKHHPLTIKSDLHQLLPGVDLPVDELIQDVIDKVEQNNRRIVGLNEKLGKFIVYCPNIFSLQDLWAKQDVINNSLVKLLLKGEDNAVLDTHNLSAINVRTHINGPEYLQYKQELKTN